MKKITTFLIVFLAGISSMYAQCHDVVDYVESKNIGGTTSVGITPYGTYRSVAQTYHYNGTGVISSVRVYGDNPHYHRHRIRVKIYNVDANNRPTTEIATDNVSWYSTQSSVVATFSNVTVTDNFALVVDWRENWPTYIKHTGNDGLGEDLTSYRSSVGGNWNSLGMGGDLYIVPSITNNNDADFSMSTQCIPTGGTVTFTDNSDFTTARMFNQITEVGYSGGETLYSWDFGGLGSSTSQNPSFTFNTAGVHTVTLTTTIDDWNGSVCQDTYSMQVSVGLDVTGAGTDLACYDSEDGEIDLTGLFGAPPYIFSVDGEPSQSGTNFSGLEAGNYGIYITDALGCTAIGSSVILTEPAGMDLTLPVLTTPATCANADGALIAAASGGVGTISYSLDNATYQANGSFTGLAAGVYTIYLMDAANGCIDSTNTFAVDNTASPTLTLIQYITIACNGNTDGEITVIGSGGTGALQYSIDGVNWQATGIFTGLAGGTYTPVVQDVAGCQGSFGPITLTEPDAISWKGVYQTPTSCNGSSDGQIDISPVIGGTGSMSYSIDGVIFQSGTNFSGLAAGPYTITVLDAAGCTATTTITVGEPAPIVVTVDTWVNLSCFESGDGELHISATGGDGDYTYTLNLSGAQTNGHFFDLDAGTYVITVMDGNDCLGSTSYTLVQPTEIVATIVTGNSTCSFSNGNILIVASGGAGGGYTYDLNEGLQINGTGSFTGLPADEYGIYVVDANGCEANFDAIVSDSDGPTIDAITSTDVSCNGGNDGSITITLTSGGTGTIEYSIDGTIFQASNVFTGLDAGSYTAVIRDANGCTGSIAVTINEPAPFTIILNTTDATCFGSSTGTITVIAGGGSGTLAYSINGINFQSSTLFDNLPFGTYTVTVRDAGGCEATSTTFISSPSQIVLSVGVLMVSCNSAADGAINANAIGGTGIIQYSLDGITYQASGYFNNLAGGATYTVYAQDANGCIVSIPFNITEPDGFTLNSTVSDVSCAGGDDGVIDLSMAGGTAPYSYQWSNLATTEDIFNLSAALYSVNISDANGCTISQNFTVSEPANPIIVNGTVGDASGAANSDGTVDITVNGGTAPYTFDWSDGSSSEDLSGLLPGSYLVTVTDANGCTTTSSFTVGYFVGLEEVYNAEALRIYPNPASNLITIDLGAEQVAERIVLVDITGKVIFEDAPNSNKFDVDVRFYAEGVYFINLHVGEEVITKRVVVNK